MREPATLGRPRAFDEDQALDAAMHVFWARGYEGASIGEICAATGLGKGSLYAAFGDKRALYLKAIARYEAAVIDPACAALTEPGDARAQLRAFMRAPILDGPERADFRGCFLCNASVDQAARDRETQALVRRGFAKIESALTSAVARIRPRASAQAVASKARLLLAAYAGLRAMTGARVERARLEDVVETALAAV